MDYLTKALSRLLHGRASRDLQENTGFEEVFICSSDLCPLSVSCGCDGLMFVYFSNASMIMLHFSPLALLQIRCVSKRAAMYSLLV